MSFDFLGLSPLLLQALSKAGFTEPTSVQAAAIPPALKGKDLIVSAQTGSGKTAAFMLPPLNKMIKETVKKTNHVQMLVLTPTRELAMQVADATKSYGAGIKDLRIATVVGGMPYGPQIKALSRRVDVLVATPGRLIDHLNAGRVKLSSVHTLVLDEADRMLDMGFIDDMDTIVAQTPDSRQTLLFSATIENTVAKLAQRMLKNPERIDISNQKQKHKNIEQSLFFADNAGHKYRLLKHLLDNQPVYQAIVFTSTKRSADELAERLQDDGCQAAALHGDMNQRQRTRTLNQLQKGRLQVLVATDVAARGIDVQGISHVINFDLPMQAEDYVHRIGRTGRAGRDGRAYSFSTFADSFKLRRIEQFTGQRIAIEEIEGLEAVRKATSPKKPSRSAKPNRKLDHKKANGKPTSTSTGSRWSKPAGDETNAALSNTSSRWSKHAGEESNLSRSSQTHSKPYTNKRDDSYKAEAKHGQNNYKIRDDKSPADVKEFKPAAEFFTRGELKVQRKVRNAEQAADKSFCKERKPRKSNPLLEQVNRSVAKRKSASYI